MSNQKKLHIIVIIAIGICAFGQFGIAQEYEITQLTNESLGYGSHPQINTKGDVVWQTGTDIAFYDESTGIVNLISTPNELQELDPEINARGDVVWWISSSPREAYYFDYLTSSVTRLTVSELGDLYPDINDNGMVTWSGIDGTNPRNDVFIWDANTHDITQAANLTNLSTINDYPAVINDIGDIAWTSNGTVKFYESSTGEISTISGGATYAHWPNLNNKGDIVWTRFSGVADQVFYYSSTTGTVEQISNVTDNSLGTWTLWPQINDNGDVVYSAYDGNDKEIFLYKGSTGVTSQLTDNEYDDWWYYQHTFNDLGEIVWLGNPLNYYEIFLYSPTSETVIQLTSNGRPNSHPHINQNGDIVWTGQGAEYVQGSEGVYIAKKALSSGSIAGTIAVDDTGLAGVAVELLDSEGYPLLFTSTDVEGTYSFGEVESGDYQVMIVEPLGYVADENPKITSLAPGMTNTLDFTLAGVVVQNTCRGKGYWKHQFDVYLKNRGHAQESYDDLSSYMAQIYQFYTPHFAIFANCNTFEDWQAMLTVRGNVQMVERARQHLAALVFNFASLKVAQYEIVTEDGKTAGDVLTFVSTLIEDSDSANDEMAKDLAEAVNSQLEIASGIISSGGVLYKGNGEQVAWNWGELPVSFSLDQNYPNPFNPTTTIHYSLPVASDVTLHIYDITGREVKGLVNAYQAAGTYSTHWKGTTSNGISVETGVYFARIQAGDYSQVIKMIYLR